MDPFHTFLALGPLAVYLLLLGILNLSRRPFLTTGARDIYVLGVAVSGFFVIGPLDLFMPDTAPQVFGPYAWIMLLALYSLCLTLLVLLLRPRLVIYNITYDQLRPILARLIHRLGLEHHWAGESLALPPLGVQLQLDRFAATRTVSLVATAADQSYQGWLRLEHELAWELRTLEVKPNPLGMVLVATSLLTLCGNVVWLTLDRQAVAQGLLEMLRL